MKYGEENDIGLKKIEALRHLAIVGEGLVEKHCETFKDNFHLLHLHYEEEK
jgi:hypothetical protein